MGRGPGGPPAPAGMSAAAPPPRPLPSPPTVCPRVLHLAPPRNTHTPTHPGSATPAAARGGGGKGGPLLFKSRLSHWAPGAAGSSPWERAPLGGPPPLSGFPGPRGAGRAPGPSLPRGRASPFPGARCGSAPGPLPLTPLPLSLPGSSFGAAATAVFPVWYAWGVPTPAGTLPATWTPRGGTSRGWGASAAGGS